MLKVKKLDPNAKLPTVAHPGEDLAYDVYALEDQTVRRLETAQVRTGIAAQAFDVYGKPLGLLVRDRSSMAARGVFSVGGVIDHGYTGELAVLLTATQLRYQIRAGDKIAQMIPVQTLTGPVVEVSDLDASSRGDKGFGSSGK